MSVGANISAKLQRPKNSCTNIEAAADECRRILADGQWHSRAEINKVCANYRVRPETIIDELFCAISDNRNAHTGGKSGSCEWVCIPDARTPELAPGETGRVPDVLQEV